MVSSRSRAGQSRAYCTVPGSRHRINRLRELTFKAISRRFVSSNALLSYSGTTASYREPLPRGGHRSSSPNVNPAWPMHVFHIQSRRISLIFSQLQMVHRTPFRFTNQASMGLFIGLVFVLSQVLNEKENGLTHTWLMKLYRVCGICTWSGS